MSKRKKKKPTQIVLDKKTNSTELMGGLILNLVLAIVPAIVPLSVVLRWLIWFVCWMVFVFVLQSLAPILSSTSKKQKILATAFLSILFSAWWPLAHSQWRQEKAEAVEGDLIGAGPVINDGKPHGFPFLQVGETVYMMSPNGTPDIMPFFPDSGIRLEWGAKHYPLFTTTVRDHNGNLVAEIKQNHWHVYPSYSVDKNYTKDTLEVLDNSGHVALQARVLPDRILVQGEWWDIEGSGVRLLKPKVGQPEVGEPKTGSLVIRMGRQMQHLEELIQPMFEYPSKDHWGESKK